MTVNYWIAQYVGDVFRREPRNVGVFVEADGEVAARFLGASPDGHIDRRKLKNRVEFVDVYKQWIEFWLSEVRRASIPNEVDLSGPHYRVISGGTVDDVATGELPEAVDYLYSLLVADRPREQIGAVEEEAASAELITEVTDAFKADNILATAQTLSVPHPVKKAAVVTGKLIADYRPTFTQENGRLYIMEAVDFTGDKKKLSRDHAGWTAYAFSDIKALRIETEPIAIVKFTDFDAEEHDHVRNGIAVLKNEARLVNWLKPEERAAFLDERREIARSHS